MKIIICMFLVMGLMSCSFNHKRRNGRTVASVGSKCKIAKHHSKNLYRVEMNSQPFSNLWYGPKRVKYSLKTYIKNGNCGKK